MNPRFPNLIVECIQHSTIKFTMENSTAEKNVLGVTVTKVGNKLETDLYWKPTDTHQYLMHNHNTVMCIKDLLHTGRL